MKRDFLSVIDVTPKEFWQVLKLAKKLKNGLRTETGRSRQAKLLSHRTLAMIFEKSSTRTRVSFEVGMTQLGGHAIFLSPNDIQMGRGETIADTARILSRYIDIIMYRAYDHKHIAELARHATVPVINALSDKEHPCQILADFMAIWEAKGTLAGLTMAYVGDGENNVTHSYCLASAMMGMNFHSASPKGYEMAKSIVEQAKRMAKKTGVAIVETDNPATAVKDADIVVTDTWVSMGDEAEKEKRLKIFKPFQVNTNLMKRADPKAIFLHDLPAYRGNEVTDEVIDGSQSVVWNEAENRLHTEKALMLFLLGKYA